jgi:hypothetical protein
MKNVLILIGLLIVGPGWCDWKDNFKDLYSGKRDDVGLAWLKIAPGARGIALGNAHISTVDDPTAIWWNPGALGRIEGTQANFTHVQHFQGIRYEFLGVSTKRGNNSFGFALGGLFVNGLEHRNEQQELLGEFGAYSFLATLSYARTLAEGLCFGAALKGIRERIYVYEYSSWLADFGVTYRALPDLWLGSTLVNVGRHPKFEEEEIAPPRGWKVGASYKRYGLLASVDAVKYIDAVLQAGIGLEYELGSLLLLRAGCTPGNEAYLFSTGFGIRWRFVKLDYAFRPYGLDLGSAHILTLTK